MVEELHDFALVHPMEPGGREGNDHYPTPPDAVLPLVRYARRRGWWAKGEPVLDPCCGEGALLDALRDFAGLVGHGIELDAKRAAEASFRRHQVRQGDALALPWAGPGLVPSRPELIVMNPPFSLAETFVRRALSVLPPRGRLCVFLRLSFIEPADTRFELFNDNPCDVLVLRKRPRHIGKGNDNVTSAWFCWPGSLTDCTTTRWLEAA